MPELVVERLAKRFGTVQVLKDVSLEVRRGEIVALLGPSGSGKTTLLRCIAGLERPDEGRIVLGERVVFDQERRIEVPPERRDLGLVFQSYALWPHRTVFENVAFGLRLRRVPPAEIRARVEEVLSRLGLEGLEGRYPHQLSGGQQQRVALARALVYNPRLLLLDEPLSNLDARLREEARIWVRELILRQELAAVYVTHDQAEAMVVADRIMLFNAGRVVQEGTPVEIYDRPANLFAAEFMGTTNRLEGEVAEVKGDRARLAGEGWSFWGTPRGPKRPGERALGVIRVERVGCHPAPAEDRPPARVVACVYVGTHWEYVLELGGLRLRARGSGPLPVGQSLWVEVREEDLWIF